MSIPEKDLKLLWGKAAGRCSYCKRDLTKDFDNESIILGEMAHVIAKKENGPRGSQEHLDSHERDKYENLILLCPTHHRLIDKAPNQYSVHQILEWKKAHESEIMTSLSNKNVTSFNELCRSVFPYLLENSQIHKQYGPESLTANFNPLSEVANIWTLKKITTVIPNNKKINNIINKNISLLDYNQLNIFYEFKSHADAFEMNAHNRLDQEAVPRFPIAFRTMIEEELHEKA